MGELENELIYVPVDSVKFKDLFDWADPIQRSRSHKIERPRLHRQDSGTGVRVEMNAELIALFRIADDVYAIEATCPHAGGPLYLGDIEELPDQTICVRCPWHSWRFDVTTGKVSKSSRTDVRAKVFPVRLKHDGTICIGFDYLLPEFFNQDF